MKYYVYNNQHKDYLRDEVGFYWTYFENAKAFEYDEANRLAEEVNNSTMLAGTASVVSENDIDVKDIIE